MEQTQELDIDRYIQLVVKRRYLFAIIVAAIIAVVVAVSYVIKPVYEAKTVVSIEKNYLNSAIRDFSAASTTDDKISAVSTIMKSRTLIFKVLNELNLGIDKMSEVQLESLIKGTQDKTIVTLEFNRSNSRNVDFFAVTYRNISPQHARDFVNTLVSKYIEENLGSKREGSFGANRFLLDQINHFKEKVGKTEGEIAFLKKDKNVILYDQLMELQKKFDALLVQYTENHPEVLKTKSEIDSVKSKLNANAGAANVKNRLAVLEREREADRRIYDELAAAYGKSEVTSQAEIQDKAGTFKIVDPAVLPVQPVSLGRIKIILIGIVGAIAGAFGLIIVLDMLDKSVKSVDSLKNIGIPVIAVIPHIQDPNELLKVRRKDIYLYSLSGIYAAALVAVIVFELIKQSQ